ncbi:hypothetical protein WA026_023647 [Henosepilachna vigintioctopunctata]|uniref:Uncharacterized protein n=1 Tax=Henosepilachna vigintioctopunctata TaxID=420089 RepID=A0AAW1VGW3_9CUCU
MAYEEHGKLGQLNATNGSQKYTNTQTTVLHKHHTIRKRYEMISPHQSFLIPKEPAPIKILNLNEELLKKDSKRFRKTGLTFNSISLNITAFPRLDGASSILLGNFKSTLDNILVDHEEVAQKGRTPEDWICAVFIPISENEDELKAENYCSVNLTLVPESVL